MIRVEIVCCSLDDALRAEQAGAGRIELCSALEVGGLTPSIGLARMVCAASRIPVMAMVRPRPGDFTYDDSEWSVILEDARALAEIGVQGLVFGALDGHRVADRSAEVAAITPGRSTFHRAIDALPDPVSAARDVRTMGFARVLTSGGRPSALDGAETIRAMAAEATVLVGGGVRASNAAKIVELTGATEIHAGPYQPLGEPFLDEIAVFGRQTKLDVRAVSDLIAAVQ